MSVPAFFLYCTAAPYAITAIFINIRNKPVSAAYIFYMVYSVESSIYSVEIYKNFQDFLVIFMIPESKGLIPHELAHEWVKDLGTLVSL
jgi:hypothetical protein